MNSSDIYFICPACKEDQSNAANLNKHLNNCVKYDDFIKHYKVSNTISCNNCKIQFINELILKEHETNCKNVH